MNFKKTCKSIVSFVLGTGMMFSGFAFNNYSNAFFTKEFYAENLEKYKNDPTMTWFLILLEILQDNREELGVKLTKEKITDARDKIVKAQTEFEAHVKTYEETKEDIRNETRRAEASKARKVATSTELQQAKEARKKAQNQLQGAIKELHRKIHELNTQKIPYYPLTKPFSTLPTTDPLYQERHKFEQSREIYNLANITESEAWKRQHETQEQPDNPDVLTPVLPYTLYSLQEKLHYQVEVAKAKLLALISYLMILLTSSSDETKHLCLDTLAGNIKKLFGENSNELAMQIRETKHNLFD